MIVAFTLCVLIFFAVLCCASFIFIDVCSASRMVNHEVSISAVSFSKSVLPYPDDTPKI